MNLGISVMQKEVLCECEGLTGSEENRNFGSCFQKQVLRELSLKQTEVLVNRVVRENAKQGVHLVVSDSYSPHSRREMVFMLMRR